MKPTSKRKQSKYRSFVVETFIDEYDNFLASLFPFEGTGAISVDALPSGVTEAFHDQCGKFRVRRVKEGRRAIPLNLESDPERGGTCVACYSDTGAGLCRGLCRALGYTAKKPETIYITITPIKPCKSKLKSKPL